MKDITHFQVISRWMEGPHLYFTGVDEVAMDKVIVGEWI